ncbi:hypothetical protein Tco_0238158 [Tanacetum coccineum]
MNLDNVPPADTEINSMMNIDVRHKEPSNQTPSLLTIPVTSTPTPTPTTEATTSLLAIPYFSSLFGFNKRVSVLEKELSQLKQVDHSALLLEAIKSQVPAVVEAHLGTRLGDSIQKAFRSYTAEFEKKAQAEKKRYINLVEKSVKDIINDENVVLAKSSSQPQSTYKAVVSLTEFELKKIILDKMQKSQSYRRAKEDKELYDGLVKSSYKLDKDLFESYGKAYSLKRDHEDKDKDEDPPAGSDQGLKRRKTSKDAKPSKSPKSKESKSSSSKGTKSQPKSSSKSTKAEESVFEAADIDMPQNQGSDLDNTSEQPNVKAALKPKEPERPLTPDSNWNIDNLTQNHLVGPAFNLLKGICRSRMEPEYNIKECRQVVHVDYFINNDLEYLRGGRSSRKYTTSTTKTKASKYDIQGIKDMVMSLWSPVKVAYDRHVVWGTSHRWYDYGYLEEIEVQKEDQQLYNFKEGDFPRLHLQDIEDMLLLLVQKNCPILKEMSFLTWVWDYECLPDVLSFLSEWKTFNWESKATIRSLISLSQRHSGPTSPT